MTLPDWSMMQAGGKQFHFTIAIAIAITITPVPTSLARPLQYQISEVDLALIPRVGPRLDVLNVVVGSGLSKLKDFESSNTSRLQGTMPHNWILFCLVVLGSSLRGRRRIGPLLRPPSCNNPH